MKSVYILALFAISIAVRAQVSATLHSIVVHVNTPPTEDCTRDHTGSFRIVNHSRITLAISLYAIQRMSDSSSFLGLKDELTTRIVLTKDSSYTIPVAQKVQYNVYAADASEGSQSLLLETQSIETCKLTIVEIK